MERTRLYYPAPDGTATINPNGSKDGMEPEKRVNDPLLARPADGRHLIAERRPAQILKGIYYSYPTQCRPTSSDRSSSVGEAANTAAADKAVSNALAEIEQEQKRAKKAAL